MTIRARVWTGEERDQVEEFSRFLQRIAPVGSAALKLGTSSRDSADIESLGGRVSSEQLPQLLRRCESENLQLAWGNDPTDPTLDVICELYDDHIEVAARPPVAESVERVLSEVVEGAA